MIFKFFVLYFILIIYFICLVLFYFFHNRCLVTGRPRGYYKFFGLSRHVLREMAHSANLPGVTKSSW